MSAYAKLDSPLTEFVARQYDDFQFLLEDLNKERKYLNYGFRRTSQDTYETKQANLCMLVFEAADIKPDSVLVDVGFGSGEQDFLLASKFKFKELHGFNIAESQVRYANARAKAEKLQKKLKFKHGQAEKMDMPAKSADRVMAIECAFYFDRPKFYKEAARVLKKNGLLVLADITFNDSLAFLTRRAPDLARVSHRSANQASWEQYFETVKIQSINREARPGAQETVSMILKWLFRHFKRSQYSAWKTLWNMAVSTQITALGFATGLIHYDLIVLRKR